MQTSNFELRVQTGHDGEWGVAVWGVPQFENVPFRPASIAEYSFTECVSYRHDNFFVSRNQMISELPTRVILDCILDNFRTLHFCCNIWENNFLERGEEKR